MFYTYIVFSKELDSFYVGYTSNLDQRINEHRTHTKGFTGRVNDWDLKYVEEFDLKKEAMSKERDKNTDKKCCKSNQNYFNIFSA